MKETRYEPENINGIVIMCIKERGRYMLVSDYEESQEREQIMMKRISSLQHRVATLTSYLK